MASQKDIILAYRHLYRRCLQAVQYAKPARYTARDRLRHTFRTGAPEHFDPVRIERTLELLECASRAKGLEHKIVKNLMHVWATRRRVVPGKPLDPQLQAYGNKSFERTLERLNATMGTCIN